MALMSGLLLWTFVEYAVHRWLMHQTRTKLLRKIWIATHRDHHRMQAMDDPSHRSLSVAVSGSLLAGSLAGCAFVFTSVVPLAITAGFALGFWSYETLHFAQHDPRISREVQGSWFARRQSSHANHHFERMNANFGFTTSLWDRVFGTWVRPYRR